MRIDRIFVAGCRSDRRFTCACIASIRRWYPRRPVSLLKDPARGPYDTEELERALDVAVATTGDRRFGWGMAKLEPLVAAVCEPGERVLVMDSDVLFLGPLLERLERWDEDFVVDGHEQPDSNIDSYYFSRRALRALDPAFEPPPSYFNGGFVLATAGVLTREHLEPFVDLDTEPPALRHPGVFVRGEQGVTNYLVSKLAQEGKATVRRELLQIWSGATPRRELRLRDLGPDSPHRRALHFAGPKRALFVANRHGRLLRHFEAAYYRRLPGGRSRHLRDRLLRAVRVALGREEWTLRV